MTSKPWLVARGLSVHHRLPAAAPWLPTPPPFVALDGVDLTLARGCVLAVVGESGCGKSTLARALVQLIVPTRGSVCVEGVDIVGLGRWLRPYRRRLQMVFQDPHQSLDATQRIGAALLEPMQAHGLGLPAERPARIEALLAEVGLDPALAERWPHALSGGQRQRVGIARALACEPELLVADEPTSALDVSVKGQVLFLLQRLVQQRGLSLLFISHDLPAVQAIAQQVLVMHRGRAVESGAMAQVLGAPLHPYTQALLAAAPVLDPVRQRARLQRAAEPQLASRDAAADALGAPLGCAYAGRCPVQRAECTHVRPALRARAGGHAVACHAVPG